MAFEILDFETLFIEKCVIFGLGVRKNSIRFTGVKLASPHLVFATLAFGSSGNLRDYGLFKFFLPRCVIYY